MKIKKFVGSSMSECLLKVKKELGENAVILDSRRVPRGGPFSFLLTDLVEVIASTEDRHLPLKGRPARPGGVAKGQAGSAAGQPVQGGMRPLNGGRAGSGANRYPGEGDEEAANAAELSMISDDIKGLKETVQQITEHLKFRQLPSLPAELEQLHRNLLDNGVEDRIASTLTQEMTLELAGNDFEDRTVLVRALHEKIARLLKAAPTTTEKGKARVIALVGPTGVGKTTTLAKMATHPQIYGRKRVALVSADTYRIAAVEQLKTFATIANIPMEAVYRPADIRRAIERYSDRDVILIDTAGRSQNDRSQLNDLIAFMEFAHPDEVHLVLSISTRLDDQLDVLAKFREADARRLIFTKLDETTSFGMILNVCAHERKPVSLLTCGQNVPDDIVSPSQAQLMRLASQRSYFREEFLPAILSQAGGWASGSASS